MFFITAFLTGLLGSFHCVGMCGPIALALPTIGNSFNEKIVSRLLYNFGRIITYSFLGLLFGTFGFGLKLAGFQQSISIGAGVLIIITVLLNGKLSSKFSFSFFSGSLIGKLFKQKSYFSMLGIGLLNGLLPCGLVYLGIAGAIATGHYIKGAEFMFYFGIGTVPIMYAVAFLGQFITLKYRNHIRHAMPYIVSIMAVMLIVRGLNLGIPYLSPQFEKETHKVSCCEKPSTGKETIKCSPKKCH